MTKSSLRLPHALLLFLAAGCALPLAAQESGPMPAAPPANSAPAAASQTAAQKPAGSSGGASGAGTAAGAAPTSGSETTAGGAAGLGAAATPVAPAVAPSATSAAAAKIIVPSGTHIPLVLHNAISTRSARPGDPVYFETLFPVMIDGKVVIPAGSYVSGEVTESKRPGRVKGRGELMIKLTTMILPNAYMVNLNAVPGGVGTGGNETTDSEGKIIGDSEKGTTSERLRRPLRRARASGVWRRGLEQAWGSGRQRERRLVWLRCF